MRVNNRTLLLESAPHNTTIERGASLSTLKTLLRSTVIALDDPVRQWLWLEIARRHDCRHSLGVLSGIQVESRKLPPFVDLRCTRFFALDSQQRHELTCVLWEIAQTLPHVTHSPLLFPLSAVLLHFHSPKDVFSVVCRLLTARSLRFVALTKSEKSRDAIILVKLTKKFGILRARKCGADAREKLRNNALDLAFQEYLEWIVSLPFNHVVRVFDCFLVEGEKFLFRVALTLALLFDKHKKQSLSLERMRAFCESISTLVTPSQLIVSALKVTRLSRKDIQRAKLKAELRSESVTLSESPFHSANDRLLAKDCVLGARIAPRSFRSSVVSDWTLLDTLWEWLPERVIVKEPIVVFCSEENGFSLQTFFTLCSDHEPTLLLIKTIKNEIFGAFCSSAWSQRLDLAQTRAGQYFGTGETFLFTLVPNCRQYPWVGLHAQHITHSQQLFQSASSRSVSVGSGGGRFGIFIDESLTRGQTDSCETFANSPLCSDSSHFDVALLEVIAFS